jgi:hypothetical protein
VLGEETDTAWMPDWYPLIVAAKYLGVPPWDLLERSVWWRDKALIAMSAEKQAKKILDNHK